ncbi:MAG: hypothetical protein Q7S92_01590 [Candidatus Diapherotrites archaeon]|nr:hypothetical protein [Candidatus Diapherotrites archaeon]
MISRIRQERFVQKRLSTRVEKKERRVKRTVQNPIEAKQRLEKFRRNKLAGTIVNNAILRFDMTYLKGKRNPRRARLYRMLRIFLDPNSKVKQRSEARIQISSLLNDVDAYEYLMAELKKLTGVI